MQIALGADHAGYEFREAIREQLESDGLAVRDHGTFSDESCDYPEYAHRVAQDVALLPDCRGILVCGSGEGMSMVANRYTGVRAALCLSAPMAEKTRSHNNANCLVLAQRLMEKDEALDAVEAFMDGPFDGGRHARRIRKIDDPQLRVVEHPMVQVKLTELRDTSTDMKRFRECLEELSSLLLAEATRSIPTVRRTVTTEIAETDGHGLERDVLLVPVLRAGLGMLEAATDLWPRAPVAHMGMSRNEDSLETEEYLCSVPGDLEEPHVIVLDPMVATGGTAIRTFDSLKSRLDAASWRLVCAVAAPEGVQAVHEQHPDLSVYTASLDERLDEDGMIVPGLGDAGDRLFGTE